MKKTTLFGALTAITILSGTAANAAIINVAAGSLTDGPVGGVGAAHTLALEYRYNADGSIDTLIDSTVPSTDSIEDTLVGVVNNSGHTINSISLSGIGTSGYGVFDFDGDGYTIYGSTGYEGQFFNAANTLLGTTTFSNITGVSGIVNFPGLTNGGHAWFLLEDQISFIAPPITVVPVPAAIWMFGSGLLGLGALRRKAQI